MGKQGISQFFAGLMVGVLLSCVAGAYQMRPGKASAGEGKTVLKLAHGLDEQHPVHQAMLVMKKRLEELTGGRATLDVYSGGVLGGEVECLEQVQNGQLAMTKVSTGALEAFLPEMKVFSIPFAFRDHEHFWNVLHAPFGKRMLDLGERANFRGLCYYDSGERDFYTTAKPIASVADVKNMKVRVMNSRVAMDMIRAMGGSPCPINWGELYTALQQGMVDAAENNWPSFITSRHFEVCKHYICSGHQSIPDMMIISLQTWKSLPEDIRAALQKAADESEVFQRKLWAEKTEECKKFAAEKGVEITTPDRESFRKACEGIVQSKDYAEILPLWKEIQEIR